MDAQEHALAEYPRESCGVVIVFKGREQYRPCRNTAAGNDHFHMHPEDYAAAEDAGEIVRIVHSHPDASAEPSQADRVQCEATGLPWDVVAVWKGENDEPYVHAVSSIEPSGYEAPLVGRQFSHGVLDCYSLCRDWYKRERGIDLPDFERHDGWWNDGHSDLYTAHFAECGFREIAMKDMQAGDAILMQIRSKNRVPNHAGIYLGDELFIHHLYGRLSSRDIFGGMWREATVKVLRHHGKKEAA